ncbi:type II toxin-antitoxin system VapC family toxin [Oscillatoria sp. CS-180]|uniref:type II toxin-antitoxin system VapC family toxin n=1 Tax=Oscillatoria sp. CS-180 TaxID=3021720 RepID=UPI00232EBE1E|nr:type II toxin-antitoxin system VapC family toxin [Oscillatoria sp. CS-180]MDB9524804.1 type II toxin-antitoxin system VapC family toxin [Oscillatoria sp. CS-180]
MTPLPMYLLDTNVISELRKQEKANPGVQQFFSKAIDQNTRLYLSVITIGELRRGVDLIRHRGDQSQADLLEAWLQRILTGYRDFILSFTATEAQVWGRLRVPQAQNAIDKQIAATALTYDLTLVTRNVQDFDMTGVRLLDPFHN